MSRLVAAAALCIATGAGAQTIYKCDVGGRIQYSSTPCTAGSVLKQITPDGGPTAADRARAQERLQDDLAEQRARDAATQTERQRAEQVTRANAARSDADRARREAEARENEKVLTHDISGWDRKTRGQIAQEEEAKRAARDQARAGAPFDPSAAVPSSSAPARWESETTTTLGTSGWTKKSGKQKVHDAARRAHDNERDNIASEREAAARSAAQNSANGDGPRWVTDQNGKIWRVQGNFATGDRGQTCSYYSSSNSVRCP